MDYKEEQKNELEALESIYYDEFQLIDSDPICFHIRVKSDECEDDTGDGLACSLKVTYTGKYPDVLPDIEIVDSENLSDSDEEDLMQCVVKYGEENLGMAMVFSLVSAAQEWLNCKWDVLKKRRQDEADQRLQEAEEAELKRFHGTVVTVETFMAWKMAFEAEIGLLDKKVKKEKESKKLTGRELFMMDQTLNESDLKFLSEGGDQVAVDESLFQDLDELALEDELSDE